MTVRMGEGPTPAKIMIVGEAYGEREAILGRPFVGSSGQELDRMLHEAKIMRSECYITNLVNARPPDNDIGAWVATTKKSITPDMVPLRDKFVKPIMREGYDSLLREIAIVQPETIIALGGVPMWALTGKWGILRWRGSQLSHEGITVFPTIHPTAILRQWELRAAAVSDLKRASRGRVEKPDYHFLVHPDSRTVMTALHDLLDRLALGPLWLDFDLETRLGHIDCAGISWSPLDALCIPLMSRERREGYWPFEDEVAIVYTLYRVLTHPNVKVRGQNLLYDCQYTYRHWHFVPRVVQDTMISHHTAFSGLKKSLDYQASLYCSYYSQWKPEKSAWKDGG